METGILLQVFFKSPLFVTVVLGATRLQVPTTPIMEAEKNGNFETLKVEPSPGFIPIRDSFCQGAMRLFEGKSRSTART